MKQLKFNPDKDMKELEKYGFRRLLNQDPTYYKNVGDIEYIIQDGMVKVNTNEYSLSLDITIYDLIKANLLIVESDEDES